MTFPPSFVCASPGEEGEWDAGIPALHKKRDWDSRTSQVVGIISKLSRKSSKLSGGNFGMFKKIEMVKDTFFAQENLDKGYGLR